MGGGKPSMSAPANFATMQGGMQPQQLSSTSAPPQTMGRHAHESAPAGPSQPQPGMNSHFFLHHDYAPPPPPPTQAPSGGSASYSGPQANAPLPLPPGPYSSSAPAVLGHMPQQQQQQQQQQQGQQQLSGLSPEGQRQGQQQQQQSQGQPQAVQQSQVGGRGSSGSSAAATLDGALLMRILTSQSSIDRSHGAGPTSMMNVATPSSQSMPPAAAAAQTGSKGGEGTSTSSSSCLQLQHQQQQQPSLSLSLGTSGAGGGEDESRRGDVAGPPSSGTAGISAASLQQSVMAGEDATATGPGDGGGPSGVEGSICGMGSGAVASASPSVLNSAPLLPTSLSRVGRKAMGRVLTGTHVQFDIDRRQPGEAQPQLEVSPITVYGSEYVLALGRHIAVNKNYICYGLRQGTIRILNINTALRALLRGHTQRVTDLAFFAEDVHLLASAGADGRVFVRRIEEVSEEGMGQIVEQVIAGLHFTGAVEFHNLRVAWHRHQQDVLMVAVGCYLCYVEAGRVAMGSSPGGVVEVDVRQPPDGVFVMGGHSGDIMDVVVSVSGDLTATSAKDGQVRIWDVDRRAVAVLTPHAGLPVSGVAFLAPQDRPASTALITGGPLNREIKLWVPVSSDPSDNYRCVQTLELTSSSSEDVEKAFFNQIAVLPKVGLVLLANAKRNAIYAVRVDYGEWPMDGEMRMTYLAEFCVTMPILSFTASSDGYEGGEGQVQIYCVQTQAIQQYALDLCQCQPNESRPAPLGLAVTAPPLVPVVPIPSIAVPSLVAMLPNQRQFQVTDMKSSVQMSQPLVASAGKPSPSAPVPYEATALEGSAVGGAQEVVGRVPMLSELESVFARSSKEDRSGEKVGGGESREVVGMRGMDGDDVNEVVEQMAGRRGDRELERLEEKVGRARSRSPRRSRSPVSRRITVKDVIDNLGVGGGGDEDARSFGAFVTGPSPPPVMEPGFEPTAPPAHLLTPSELMNMVARSVQHSEASRKPANRMQDGDLAEGGGASGLAGSARGGLKVTPGGKAEVLPSTGKEETEDVLKNAKGGPGSAGAGGGGGGGGGGGASLGQTEIIGQRGAKEREVAVDADRVLRPDWKSGRKVAIKGGMEEASSVSKDAKERESGSKRTLENGESLEVTGGGQMAAAADGNNQASAAVMRESTSVEKQRDVTAGDGREAGVEQGYVSIREVDAALSASACAPPDLDLGSFASRDDVDAPKRWHGKKAVSSMSSGGGGGGGKHQASAAALSQPHSASPFLSSDSSSESSAQAAEMAKALAAGTSASSGGLSGAAAAASVQCAMPGRMASPPPSQATAAFSCGAGIPLPSSSMEHSSGASSLMGTRHAVQDSSLPAHSLRGSSEEVALTKALPTMVAVSMAGDALLAQMKQMQESMQALVDAQKEIARQLPQQVATAVSKEGKRIEVALGQRMEKVIKANADAQYARIQEETVKREKMETEKVQKITAALTQAISRDIPIGLEKSLKKEFAALGPAVAKQLLPPLSDVFQKFVMDKVAPQMDKALSVKLESVLVKQMQTLQLQTQGQMQTIVKQALQDSMRSHFQQTVIPSFETACKTMFEQMDQAFRTGMQEHTSHAQQQLASSHTALASTLQETVANASALTTTLRTDIADSHRKLLTMLETASSRVMGMPKQSNGGLPDKVLSLQLVEESLDPTIELSRLVAERKYEDAFNKALSQSNVAVVSWLCSQIDASALFGIQPLPLSQGVLLALVQQLGCDLKNDTARKLVWIQQAALALNPQDPLLARHMRGILEQLYQHLHQQVPLLNNNADMAGKLRLVIHLVNSLLVSCK
ncbi:hypothetical protein CBR_g8647 [Chara braunii]|uniref:Uncharacterized protein n=1 Tax=Chara braunii TaxID=69332 RepID=A0A388JS93_CHABU|nr:hypothetical protein CBR_g8647 [Chara braunii]|eukprot:GBG60627.1 hypothetical protein CBR_g8647 [Chara braunii]